MPRHGSVPSEGDPFVTGMALNIGPAHAVYFATYEAVKHLMGGNQTGTHHPLAAGTSSFPPKEGINIRAHIAPLATSGACATIASDALMNPFDGMSVYHA